MPFSRKVQKLFNALIKQEFFSMRYISRMDLVARIKFIHRVLWSVITMHRYIGCPKITLRQSNITRIQSKIFSSIKRKRKDRGKQKQPL